jgi:hypothetical protein
MKTTIDRLTGLFLIAVAVASALWLWAGWMVEIDGASVPMMVPSLLMLVSLLLAIGVLTAKQQPPVETPAPSREISRRPALKFTVKQGKRYKAEISLGFFEQVATNEMIAGMFAKAGFTDVTVTGSGAIRYAEGRWAGADATAEMPPQIVSATEIAEGPTQPTASPSTA